MGKKIYMQLMELYMESKRTVTKYLTLKPSISDGECESDTLSLIHDNMGCKSTENVTGFWHPVRKIKTRSMS